MGYCVACVRACHFPILLLVLLVLSSHASVTGGVPPHCPPRKVAQMIMHARPTFCMVPKQFRIKKVNGCFNLFCATIPVSICGSLQSSCWLTACVTQLSITLVIMAPNDLRLANMKWRLGTRLREIEAERIRVEMEFLEDLHNLRSSFIGPWPLLDSDILLQTIRVDNILRAHNIDID